MKTFILIDIVSGDWRRKHELEIWKNAIKVWKISSDTKTNNYSDCLYFVLVVDSFSLISGLHYTHSLSNNETHWWILEMNDNQREIMVEGDS